MLYECACGYTSITATAFYRHLAQSKDAPGKHQLVHAKATDMASAPGPPPTEMPRAANEAIASRIPAAPATQSQQSQAALTQPPNGSTTRQPATASSSQATPLVPYPRPAPASQSPPESSFQPLPDVSPQPLRHRQQRTQPLFEHGDGVGQTAAVQEPAVELDCTSQHVVAAPGLAGVSNSANALFMQAGSVFGSVIMYGLNPIRMFGLSEALGVAEQGQGAAAGAHPQALQSRQAAPPTTSSVAEASSSGDDSALCLVGSVAAVLTWRDPWRSLRVLAMLLYMGICLQQLFGRSLPVLPSTALLAAALLYLAQNVLRAVFQPALPPGQSASQRLTNGGQHTTPAANSTVSQDAQELQLYRSVHSALEAVAGLIIPVLAATAVLIHRALSGRHLATTAVTGIFLWTAMVIAELRIFSQLPFTMLLLLAVFTIPALYVRSREGLDKLVEDMVRLLLRLLLRSSRKTLGMSVVAALVVAACTSRWNLVLRVTVAFFSSLAVLLWQARPTSKTPPAGSQ